MSIILTWVNPNPAGNQLKVWRKDGLTISPQDKGTTVATLDSNAVTYTDTTTVLGQNYAYLIEVIAQMGSVYSRPTSTTDLRSRGPGPQTLIRGDATLGYFGEVDAYALPSLVAALSWAPGTSAVWLSTFRWHKFIRRGKIVYVANAPCSAGGVATATFLNGNYVLANYGLASGVQWNFADAGGRGKSNIVTQGAFSYHLRAPRAFPDNWDGVSYTNSQTLDPTTEFNELIQAMYQGSFIPNNIGRVSSAIVGTVLGFRSIIAAESSVTPRANVISAAPQRYGNFIGVSDYLAGLSADTTQTSNVTQMPQQNSAAALPQFWPVMQLIEE